MSTHLSKDDLYSVHSDNIRYTKIQLDILRKKAREFAIEYYWYLEEKNNVNKKLYNSLLAITNLYAYVLCSRFELQLYKVIQEKSSAAFNNDEIERILLCPSIYEKWKKCIQICFLKTPDINWDNIKGHNLSVLFADNINYMKEFQDIITMRNRLAHGQWYTQLNSANNRISIPNALDKYSDISKLVLLSNKLDVLVSIVETIVVYVDKKSPDFEKKIDILIKQSNNFDSRIERVDLRKYINSEYIRFTKEQKNKKNAELWLLQSQINQNRS